MWGQFQAVLAEDPEWQPAAPARPNGILARGPKVMRVVAVALLLALGAVAAWAAGRAEPESAALDSAEGLARAKRSRARHCVGIGGVKVLDKDSTSVWPACSPKWSVNCSHSGCCSDWGMQCYVKDQNWSACMANCQKVDERNQSWSCEVVAPAVNRTRETCIETCRARGDCKQAVYSTDDSGSCLLSKKRHSKIVWASDNFHSSFCGDRNETGAMNSSMHLVQKQLPFKLVVPLVNCSWGGEDCSQTQCCNDVKCDKDFGGCWGYSCYKKDEYFSGCSLWPPPKAWNGTWQGGPREHRTIAAAGSQVAVQESSLYCFSVVNWKAGRPTSFWNSEAELADNLRAKGAGICQCDSHDFYDGDFTPTAEWGSFSNIDFFQQIWQQVKNNGRWKNHGWTVKADVDSVFIPKRLKDHLYNLRTPLGSRVYLENIWYKFKFMGALEILTREALQVFLEFGHSCIRGAHDGGEDFFMKSCMDGLGIDHQSDFDLLRDRYAAQNGPCTDGWKVAYHYMKKVEDWNQCYNEAMR